MFDALIPNLEFDEVALTGRTPTPVEQLGYPRRTVRPRLVTREEFEQAKRVCSGKSEEFMTEQENTRRPRSNWRKGGGRGRSAGRRGGCLRRQIVGRGRKLPGNKENALHHAEIEAIEKACKKLVAGGCTAAICTSRSSRARCGAGALINSRMKTVYYGARPT